MVPPQLSHAELHHQYAKKIALPLEWPFYGGEEDIICCVQNSRSTYSEVSSELHVELCLISIG